MVLCKIRNGQVKVSIKLNQMKVLQREIPRCVDFGGDNLYRPQTMLDYITFRKSTMMRLNWQDHSVILVSTKVRGNQRFPADPQRARVSESSSNCSFMHSRVKQNLVAFFYILMKLKRCFIGKAYLKPYFSRGLAARH